MRASLRRSLSAVAITMLTAACATAPLPALPISDEPIARRPRGPRRSLSLGVTFGPTTPRAIAQATEGHGAWVSSERYGAVWLPAQPQGFIPYVTDGRWRVTDAGWFWQSTLPWGDLAFHYGRWIPWGSRWGWVPGTQFAPAWVDWRAGNGWVAWAPRSPQGAPPGASFVYCPAHAALDATVSRAVVQGAAASSIYPRTQPVAPRVGYLSATYAFGPPDGAVPAAQPAPLTSLVGADTALSAARADAPDTEGETLAEPPTEVADVPAAVGVEPDLGAATARDDRAPVRIRTEDLSRVSSARVSVVNMPYGVRGELFQRRPRVAASPAPPVADDPSLTEPAPLPPPADAPLAWWPMAARGRALRRGAGWAPGASPAQALPSGPPTAPLIGMSGPPPPPFGVPINTGGGLGVGVAVVPVTPASTVVNVAPRVMAAPAVNAAPVSISVAR